MLIHRLCHNEPKWNPGPWYPSGATNVATPPPPPPPPLNGRRAPYPTGRIPVTPPALAGTNPELAVTQKTTTTWTLENRITPWP
eukprot:4616251-Amphidinium_carterae.1